MAFAAREDAHEVVQASAAYHFAVGYVAGAVPALVTDKEQITRWCDRVDHSITSSEYVGEVVPATIAYDGAGTHVTAAVTVVVPEKE
jgi:hypothetical protein